MQSFRHFHLFVSKFGELRHDVGLLAVATMFTEKLTAQINCCEQYYHVACSQCDQMT